MTRAELLAAAAAAAASPAPTRSSQPIAVEVTLQRDADELLAPFTVAIALDNTAGHVVVLEFPTADLFRIDVIRNDLPVWSSVTNHKPVPVVRRISVPAGRTKLASMTIDGTSDEHRAYAPGKYTVRVAMLGTTFGAVIDKEIEFVPPMKIADAMRLKAGTVVTVAGEQQVIGGIPSLHDVSGSLRMSRSLGLRPTGIYVVRGFLDAYGDDRVFDIGRFAPAYENAPSPTP